MKKRAGAIAPLFLLVAFVAMNWFLVVQPPKTKVAQSTAMVAEQIVPTTAPAVVIAQKEHWLQNSQTAFGLVVIIGIAALTVILLLITNPGWTLDSVIPGNLGDTGNGCCLFIVVVMVGGTVAGIAYLLLYLLY